MTTHPAAFLLKPALLVAGLCLLVSSCGRNQPLPRENIDSSTGSVLIHADVWADNWFALYLGDELLIEDSVPITTERSFNAESFSFRADYPIVLNLVAKDFKENDSGLEYVGTQKQQMGDGGIIAQFTDAATGQPLAGTNSKWRCTVIHRGPLSDACEHESNPVAGVSPCEFTKVAEPAGWKTADFDDSSWQLATEHTVADVRPKDGYDKIDWNSSAKLIWGPDLKKDNTVLLRIVIHAPSK